MKRLLVLTLALGFWRGAQAGEARSPALDDHRSVSDAAEWIDFEFYRDSRIFLPVTVNGYETLGVLDSGAAATVIDAPVARAAGIVGSRSASAVGTSGSVDVQLAQGVTVAVGDLVLNNLTVALLDLSDVAGRLLGRPLPVILGREVFERTVVDIDYANRRIAFRDPVGWEYGGAGEIVPLVSRGGSRVVELRVEDGAPILAGFDIGQGSALTILKPHADEIELLTGRASATIRTGGVGGATIDRITSVQNVTFGRIRFQDVPVLVPIEARGAFNTTSRQANLGTGIFSRFRMIVDYQRDRLILEPESDVHTRPFWRNRAGMFFELDDDGLEIVHTSEGSPAARAGLRAGDIVTNINGEPVEDDYWTGDLWRWSSSPAGTEVVLTIASDRVFRLRLEDFY